MPRADDLLARLRDAMVHDERRLRALSAEDRAALAGAAPALERLLDDPDVLR